ncbi:MAG: HAD family phosphatase [Collinsella sp.]|nr:HAD family phosphatase [Collinsella sp.]
MPDASRLPRAFIFDCDGTLLDSMGMWLRVQPELLASHGIETTPADFARFEHLSLEDECQAYHDTWGICSSGAEVMEELDRMLIGNYDGAVPPREGALEFLEAAHEAGIPMAVATSTPRHLVEIGLARCGMAPYINRVTTTGEAGAPKGQPDVYDLALERLCQDLGLGSVDHGDVWVFEDAVFGLKGAGLGGYRRVGIHDPAGRSDREDVRANCEIFIDDYRSLPLSRIIGYAG